VDLVAVKDANLSLGQKFRLRVTESISLFAHQLGMKFIAASGKIQIQAQNGEFDIGAAKLGHVYSLEQLLLEAPSITLRASGAEITLGNGTITSQCQGTHTYKAATHNMTGPDCASPNLPKMPQSALKTNEKFVLASRSGAAVEQFHYEIRDEKGALKGKGQTQGNGGTDMVTDKLIRPLTMSLKK